MSNANFASVGSDDELELSTPNSQPGIEPLRSVGAIEPPFITGQCSCAINWTPLSLTGGGGLGADLARF